MANDINHNDLDKETREFLEQMESVKLPPSTRGKEDIWSKIDAATDDTINEVESSDSNNSRVLWPWYAAAASVAAIIGFLVFYQSDTMVQVATANGQVETVELPDGSTVTLNAQSAISYESDNPRQITLEGEAFFEVTEGDEFSVATSQGVVTVLGTSFNIKDRGESYNVECKTGRVRVDIANHDFSEEITAGQGVSSTEGDATVTEVSTSQIGGWQLGELYFEDESVVAVIAELERQYDMNILIENIDNRRFTGYITIGDNTESLEQSLTMLCEPLGLTYEITDYKSATISID
ncbi:MAG: FecR domain-containing protein [Bacteroidota bacterium]